MTAATLTTEEAETCDHASAILNRARNPQVYQGSMPIIGAMADLDHALRTGNAGHWAENLIKVIRDIRGDDAAEYVSGEEGGE